MVQSIQPIGTLSPVLPKVNFNVKICEFVAKCLQSINESNQERSRRNEEHKKTFYKHNAAAAQFHGSIGASGVWSSVASLSVLAASAYFLDKESFAVGKLCADQITPAIGNTWTEHYRQQQMMESGRSSIASTEFQNSKQQQSEGASEELKNLIRKAFEVQSAAAHG